MPCVRRLAGTVSLSPCPSLRFDHPVAADAGGSEEMSDTGSPPWGAPADGGPWSPLCPETSPTIGSGCAGSLWCEYGEAWWDIACDTVIECVNGQWIDGELPGTCFPEPGPNAPACPEGSLFVNPAQRGVPRGRTALPLRHGSVLFVFDERLLAQQRGTVMGLWARRELPDLAAETRGSVRRRRAILLLRRCRHINRMQRHDVAGINRGWMLGEAQRPRLAPPTLPRLDPRGPIARPCRS